MSLWFSKLLKTTVVIVYLDVCTIMDCFVCENTSKLAYITAIYHYNEKVRMKQNPHIINTKTMAILEEDGP